MAILVDQLADYQWPHLPTYLRGLWSHMMTDDLSPAGLDELHAMAQRIGLPRHHFQDKPRHPHYDLRPDKRELAIHYGAEAVTTTELIERCIRPLRGSQEL
jgi:hypothetical protein